MPDQDTAERSARPGRGRHLAVTVLVAVAGIGAGVLATTALTGGDDTGTSGAGSTAVPDAAASADELEAPIAGGDPGPGAASATTPEAAVVGFLDAERAGDLATSYTFLSTTDRAELTSAAGWEAVHAELLAPVLGYTIEAVDATEADTRVTALVEFEPSLDVVVGLVPSRARASLAVVADDEGRWGVALAESVLEPLYPSDDGVVPAAQAWAAARADCVENPPGQHVPLLGVSDPAAALCDSPPPAVGPPGPLPDIDAAPFLTAFGASATTWARVVEVDGPQPLRAVLAPLGESWIVVGVLTA